MGCGLCGSDTIPQGNRLGLSPIIDMKLDKWNSRQINAARTRFKQGLQPGRTSLEYDGFEHVFPNLRFLPKVTPSIE